MVEDHKFLVHLGSATRAVDECAMTAYYRTQLSLSASPVPVYSLPGNNDWPECPDPTEGWQYYQSHMMEINNRWNTTLADYQLKRQTQRKENFSFLYKRVLFVGLHMVTNSNEDETTVRLQENMDWVNRNVQQYWNHMDIIFIMGYGRLLATENAPFYNAMVDKMSNEWSSRTMVYARRASKSEFVTNVGGVSNFLELLVGNEWPIMDVRIRTKIGEAATVQYREVEVQKEDDEDVDDDDDEKV